MTPLPILVCIFVTWTHDGWIPLFFKEWVSSVGLLLQKCSFFKTYIHPNQQQWNYFFWVAFSFSLFKNKNFFKREARAFSNNIVQGTFVVDSMVFHRWHNLLISKNVHLACPADLSTPMVNSIVVDSRVFHISSFTTHLDKSLVSSGGRGRLEHSNDQLSWRKEIYIECGMVFRV